MKKFEIQEIIQNEKSPVKLIGKIHDGDHIEPSTYICFKPENAAYNFRIINVEKNESNTILEISKSDFKAITDWNLLGNTFQIKKAVRGADITLTSAYGAGVSWWAPFVLLIIIGLLGWGMIIWGPY